MANSPFANARPRRRLGLPLAIGAVISVLAVMIAGSQRDESDMDHDVAERLSVDQLLAKVPPFESNAKGPVTALVSGTLNWSPLGPLPITGEYWSGNVDASGRTSSIAVHPTDPLTAYIAAAGGGVWKTADGGMTWTPLTDQLSSLSSGAVALDPSDPNTILYGTGEQHYSGDSLYGDGLFRSTDAGATWSKIAMRSQVGSYIARVAASPGTLHVCSDNGYARSVDGGASWTVFKPGGSFTWCNDLVRSAQAPGTWYASFYAMGVYMSTDDGVTWTQLTGLPASGFQRVNLAISDSDRLSVYASLIGPSGGLFGMYRTRDGGVTWSVLASTPNYTCTQGWYDNTVVVSPSDPETVFAAGVFTYCGNAGVIMSSDGGASWSNITVASDSTRPHPDQHFLTFGPDGALWIATDGGVWARTVNAGSSTWNDLNHGLSTTQMYTVAVHPTDSMFMIAGTQDNGSVAFMGTPDWPQVEGGDGGPVAIASPSWTNPDTYFTTDVLMSPLYRWLRPLTSYGIVTGPWSGDRANWANSPLVTDPTLPDTLLAGTYRLWQTTNSGASWSLISPDLTAGGHLRSTAVSALDPNTIYTGSSDGRVFMTSDRGMTWQARSAGLPNAPIPDIIISPTDSSSVYLCVNQSSGGRVFRSTDAGMTWQDQTGSLPNGVNALTLAIDFTNGVTYIGSDGGVYSTTDGGMTWTQEAQNLPNVAVYSLRIDLANRLIVAATHGRGMWRASLGGGGPLPTASSRGRSTTVSVRLDMPAQPIPSMP
jgi:photosystem II stability/assembly factor-like uncharacterized protein